MLDPAFGLSPKHHPISSSAATTASTAVSAAANDSGASSLPSFADFQFKVIGKQPDLLNRFSAPEHSKAYHSPTPPVSPAVSPIITRPPLSRPSLLQALTSEDPVFISSENQNASQMPLPLSANQSSMRAPNTRTSNDLIPPIDFFVPDSSCLGTERAPARSRAPFLKSSLPAKPQGQPSHPASSSVTSENSLLSRPPSTQSVNTTSASGSSRLPQQGQNTACQASALSASNTIITSVSTSPQAHSPLVDQRVPTHDDANHNLLSPHLVGGIGFSRAPIQLQASSVMPSTNPSTAVPANNVFENLHLERDFDALHARLQEASAALAMLAPQPSAPPFFDMFSLSSSEHNQGGQSSSNPVTPADARSMHKVQLNTEDNSKVLITQNLTLIHTLQTNVNVLLQTAQTLCSGLRTAEMQAQAVLSLVEKERLRNEESRAAEEEAKRGMEEDLRRFAAWRDEVREWYRTAEGWRRSMEEKVDKAMVDGQDVRAALDRMKEQEQMREERMRQEAIAESERVAAHQRAVAEAEQVAAREEAEKSRQEQQEAQARIREMESQRELEKQKQFNKQRAEVMAMKQQASMKNAAKIRADREKENARLVARVGGATEAPFSTGTNNTMLSTERPVAPPTSSLDSNSSDSRQPSSSDSVMTSQAQTKPRAKQRNTPLSGGVEVSKLKEGGNTIREKVDLDIRPTSVTPSVQSSSSGTSGGRDVSTVSAANTGPSFVPAATEAGRQVVTEMPFSSITLASEKNVKKTQEPAAPPPSTEDRYSAASQNYVTLSSSASPHMSMVHNEATNHSANEYDASSFARISRAEQSANLRHLRTVVPRVEESGSGDRSVRTRASVEKIRKNSSGELIVKKEEDRDSVLFGEGSRNANNMTHENAVSVKASSADDVSSIKRADRSVEQFVEASSSITEANTVLPPRSRPRLLVYANHSRAQAETDFTTRDSSSIQRSSGQSPFYDHAQSLDNRAMQLSDQAQSESVTEPTSVALTHSLDNQHDTSFSLMHQAGVSNQPDSPTEEFRDNCTTRRDVERTPETPVSVGGGSDMYSAGVTYSNADQLQDHGRDQTSNARGNGENEERYDTQDGQASQRRSSRYSPCAHSPPPPATFYEFNSRSDRYSHRSPALHSPPSEHPPSPIAGRKRTRDPDEWFGNETNYRPRRLRPDEQDRDVGRSWRDERPPSPRRYPPSVARRRSPTPEWQRRHDGQQRFRRSPSPERQRVIYKGQPSPISPNRGGTFAPRPRIARPDGANRVLPRASTYRPAYNDNEDTNSSETRDPRVRVQDKGDRTSETQTYAPRYRQDTESIAYALPRNDEDLGGDHTSLLSRMSDTQKPLPTFTHQRGIPNRGRGRGGRLPLMSRLSSGVAPLQDRLSG